jgi:hypothetical protein
MPFYPRECRPSGVSLQAAKDVACNSASPAYVLFNFSNHLEFPPLVVLVLPIKGFWVWHPVRTEELGYTGKWVGVVLGLGSDVIQPNPNLTPTQFFDASIGVG